MTTFEKTEPIPVDAEQLYRWHARPGAFRRLVPPWQQIDVVDHEGGIEDGARRRMKIHQGPLRLTWEAVHRDHIPGEQFVDEQVRGPFARWVHTHRFEQREPGNSWLVDHVDYRLPFGRLGKWFGEAKTRRMLERMFAFRHRRTADDLRRHADTDRQMTVAITGTSGMIGSALQAFLTTGGHRVIRLVRRRRDIDDDAIYWSPSTGEIDAEGLEGVDAVVHLAAENIDGRWTPAKRRAIEESRVRGTELLAKTLAELRDPPEVFASASGIGWYGDTGGETVDEGGGPGTGFLADVCRRWEEATTPADAAGIRTLQLRLGVVLDPSGGALPKMLPAVRYGLASRLGAGTQWMSWIDLDDAIGAILFVLTCDDLDGPVNLTAPQPVTNAELFETMADIFRRPAVFPVPAPVVKLTTGPQTAEETALISQQVAPKRLRDAGFSFFYPDVEQSLRTKLGFIPDTGRAPSMSLFALTDPGLHGPR